MHRRLSKFVGGGCCLTFLAACAAVNSGLSPTTPALTAAANSVGPPSRNFERPSHVALPARIKEIKINANTCCYIAVDSALSHIYVGQVNSLIGEAVGGDTVVIEGGSLSVLTKAHGFGGAKNVDSKTHKVWLLGGIYGGVELFSGRRLRAVENFGLSGCPATSWVDATRRYAWIVSNCYTSSSSTAVSVWVINADTQMVVAGPINVGRANTVSVLNPVTGKYYINEMEVNPSANFALSSTSFGVVLGANDITGMLYVQDGKGLDILNGYTEKLEKRLSLSFEPGAIAVNSHLNRIYLSNGANSIQVRGGTNGKFLQELTGPAGARFLELGADVKHGRIYALGVLVNRYYLYQFDDIN